MPLVSSARDSSLLQLQYLTNSIGLQRQYLDEDKPDNHVDHDLPILNLEGIIKPVPLRSIVDIERPDIEWYPKYETYIARSERLAKTADKRPTTLPEKFPAVIDSPRVWTGADFAGMNKYLVHLSDEDVDEIKEALSQFHVGLNGDSGPEDVTMQSFPLPNLGERLKQVAHNVHRGTGFNVIRGLKPTDFTPLDNVIVYLGITSYIADIRGCQDYDGRMIVHIKDVEQGLPEATGRPSPYTNRAQPFHTDMCDVLSMYALDTAVSGGHSLLASSGMIYNELASTRPDLIHLLADDKWVHNDFNKVKSSWYCRQLLHNYTEHGPSFLYSRRPLTGAPFSPHHPDVPTMSEEQAEALDAVHFIAQKHQLKIALQPGDIEIFNNLALFHARDGFVDSGEDEMRDCGGDSKILKRSLNGTRHMLRLWLRSSNSQLAWQIPSALEENSALIYGDTGARDIARWDIHKAPPINRTLVKHYSCS